MKKLFLSIAIIATTALSAFANVYVHGYTRRDGTYVQPHYRTDPDGIPYNNYSYPGNYNPNTGRISGPSHYSFEDYSD